MDMTDDAMYLHTSAAVRVDSVILLLDTGI